VSASYERVNLLFERHRYADAEKELRGLLAKDPDDGVGHALLALCRLELKRPEEALDDARRAVHAAPDTPLSHHALALAHLARDESKKALAAIREAIRLDPEEPDHFAVLGSIHLGRSEWKPALDAASEGLRLDPEHAGCANLKSMALRKTGQSGAASHELEAQLARDPLDPDTHANRGWQLLEEGNTKRATLAFREALRLDPEHEWAREGLVEAIKARNPVYRIVLKYTFFMGRQRPGMQWGILIGAYVLYRVMREVSRNRPELAPWLTPLIVLYFICVALSWFGDHFFNLLLCLHPQGRYALSKEQIRGAASIGAALVVLAIAAMVWGFASGTPQRVALVVGVASLCLMVPVSAYFSCPRRGPRRAIGLAILVQLAVVVTGAFVVWFNIRTLVEPVVLTWMILVVATPWYVNFQLARR
jgi:tetratricopeptide (TPR) repeat protein